MVLVAAAMLLGVGSASAAGVVWTANGPQGATIDVFTVDPGSAVVYAGGGRTVWSSGDGGSNWTKAGSTQVDVGWLASDPSGGVLYASNDYQSCPFERSTDDGATWTRVCTGISGPGTVALDPTSGDLYANFSGHIFTSTDKGQSWTATGTGPTGASSLAVDHGSPDQLYAGTGDGHVWRSDDAGATFDDLGQVASSGVFQIVVAPDGIYAVARGNGLFRSDDQGQTWTEVDAGLGAVAISLVASSAPGTFYLLGLHHDYVTTNSGATWDPSDDGLTFAAGGVSGALWIDPSDQSHLLTSNGRDVYRSTNGGAGWAFSSAGLTDNQAVTALAVDASGPSTLYAGTHYGGLFVSTDEGDSWSPAGSGLSGSIFAVAADPSTPGTVYVSTGDALFKSTDGGASWARIDSGFPSSSVIWSVAVDPTDPQRVYAAAKSTVERSTDGGATWTAATASPVQPSNYGIDAFVIDASDPSRMYAAGSKVWVSTDHGDTWSSSISALPGGDYAQSLAQDPGDPARLIAGGFDHSYQSTDAGATWTTLNVPGGAVAFDPGGNGTRYVASGFGVEVSPDGTTWGSIRGSDTAARFGTGIAFDGSRVMIGSSTGVAEADLVAPAVATLAPSGVGSRGATVRATVNPEGLGTSVIFQYGTTTEYGQSSFPTTAGDGGDEVTITDLIEGLKPATTYHYRAVVLGDGGVAVGGDQMFTTYGDQPDVVTGATDGIATDRAVLHGTVNPNGLSTTLAYDLGTSLGSLARESIGPIGSGTSTLPEALPVYSLLPDTTYYYRLIAGNIQDTTYGDIESFRTAPAPPSMAGPAAVDLTARQVVESSSLLLHLTWVSEPGSHAICSHLIRESYDNQPFSTLPLGTLPGSATNIGVTPGHDEQLSIAAVSCDGTQSGWATGDAVHPALVGQSAATAGSAWSLINSVTDLAGSELRTTSPNAHASFTTNAYEAGWVATTGPKFGRALVSADGGLTWSTVNLHAQTIHHRVLVYQQRWGSAGSHTILIRALATAGRPLLSIDGFVVLH
jgi:hypothetical protein